MDSIRELTPDSPEAQQAIYNLLGTTLAELKEIDKTVVGSSKNISGIRTDLKNVFNFVPGSPQAATVVNAGVNVQPPVGSLHVTHIPTPQPPVLQQPPSTVLVEPQVQDDPNQLVFDFSKKITPDTINDKLDAILVKLDKILDKLE